MDGVLNTTIDNTLEYGCGSGQISFLLSDQFRNIILADTSEGMLNVVRDKIEKHRVQNMHPIITKRLSKKK